MSKILSATADAQGKVYIDGFLVEGAVVLSQGKQSSAGLLVIEGEKVFYLPSSATDIQTTIEKLISTLTTLADSLTKIGMTFTSIGAGMTGATTAPPPTLPADVAVLTAKVGELNAIKTELNTLKGALK